MFKSELMRMPRSRESSGINKRLGVWRSLIRLPTSCLILGVLASSASFVACLSSSSPKTLKNTLAAELSEDTSTSVIETTPVSLGSLISLNIM